MATQSSRKSLGSTVILLLVIISLVASYAYAVNELTLFTTRLNWFDGNDSDSPRTLNRTLLVVWSGGTPTAPGLTVELYLNVSGAVNSFNFTVNNNCGFGPSTANCTCDSIQQKANCTVQNSVSIPFGVTWNGTGGPFPSSELSLSVTGANATDPLPTTYVAKNLSWLRIPESKVFHTLLEFGRGRGNYFFDSAGRETSAGVGTGQPYLPNGSRIELNYLHKAFNVRQYYELPTEKAENATWKCTYPNSSVVRNHLTTSLKRAAGKFNASYKIVEIEGSFERQGYLGQQFESSEAILGQSFVMNCTNFAYTLGNASGNISVDIDDFNLSFRDRESVNFTATTGTVTVFKGTQEVIINYTIMNKEIFPVTDVIVEIGAPNFSEFVGVRGELFGVGRKKYEFKTSFLPARGNESISLVARYNTTDAPAIDKSELSGPSRISVVNPWDKNAYNPAETIYDFQLHHSITVDLGTTVRQQPITDLFAITSNITNLIVATNATLFSTMNRINESLRDVLQGINTSMQIINQTMTDRLARINESLFTINETLVSRLVGINLSLSAINESLVDRLSGINRSIYELLINLTNITFYINTTLVGINISIIDKIQGVNTSLQIINQTLVDRIAGMNVSLSRINESIFDFLTSFNRTIFSQIQNLTNITVEINRTIGGAFGNISRILVRLDRIEEFENELIFLVTDSFGAQQEAIKQVGENDIGGAVESMKQANQDLLVLANRIQEERALALEQPVTPSSSPPVRTASAVSIPRSQGSGFGGFATGVSLGAILVILLLVIHHMHAVKKNRF